MAKKVTVTYGYGTSKEFELIGEKIPHYLVESKKEPHGWLFYDFVKKNGMRECTQERLLVNHYNGCSLACEMCYTRTMPGYFETFWKTGAVAVFKDYDLVLKKKLARLHTTSCLYLSPVTDPFQALEKTYHLSEKIIHVATEFGIPVEFITKKGSNVPDTVFKLIKSHPHEHSFVQFTTMTCRNDVMRAISPTADRFDAQVKAITRAADHGIRTIVARIDPVFPLITDSRADLEYIVESVKDAGATHIIMSCVDIPRALQSKFYAFAEQFTDVEPFKELYRNNQVIAGDLNANLDYRHKLFALGREITTTHGLTFSLCMEFEKFQENGKWRYKGFNDQFMTSRACEGIEIPLYVRKDLTSKFQPFSDLSKCDGNCLASAKHGTASACQGVCGDEMFRNAQGLKLKDYRRLGKTLFPK